MLNPSTWKQASHHILNAYVQFTKNDYTLWHQVNLDRFQNIEVVQIKICTKKAKTAFIILFRNSKIDTNIKKSQINFTANFFLAEKYTKNTVKIKAVKKKKRCIYNKYDNVLIILMQEKKESKNVDD